MKTEVEAPVHPPHILFYWATKKCKQHLIVEQNFQDFICDDLNWGGEKSWDQSNHGEEFSKELMQLSHQRRKEKNRIGHV